MNEQLSIDDLLPKQQRNKPIEVLKLFELFAGYGSQSLALKRFNIPFESVGICEVDSDAIIAYAALHCDLNSYIDEGKTLNEKKQILMSVNVGFDYKKMKSTIPKMKFEKVELLYVSHVVSKNYGDIKKIDEKQFHQTNFLTYSFPCQDISVAGKQRGLSKDSGTRSSLLWECHRIIEAKRPEYLMMENVKNLVGKQNMPDFQAWLDTLTLLGYNNYWKIVNAKHCGVPQNRERVFCVSIRQDVDDGLFRFEEPFDNGIRLKDILESDVDEKYYLSELVQQRFVITDETLTKDIIGTTIGVENTRHGQRDIVYNQNGIMGSCCSTDYKQPKQILIREATKQGYAIASGGDSINLEHPNSKTRRGRVGVGVAQTLTTSCNQAVVEPNAVNNENSLTYFKNEINQLFNIIKTDSFGGNPQAGRIYGIDGIAPTINTCGGGQREPKIFNQYRIRKLTNKEVFRLMGLTEQEIELIQSTGISNSQQYKMAGNSIVVDAMKFLKNINGGD